MDLILQVEGNNYIKFKEKLLVDEVVNRASILFKEAKQFGKGSGYLCIISGAEDKCKRALELAKSEDGKEMAKELSGKDKEKILKKLKEEEAKAIEGFGGIFG